MMVVVLHSGPQDVAAASLGVLAGYCRLAALTTPQPHSSASQRSLLPEQASILIGLVLKQWPELMVAADAGYLNAILHIVVDAFVVAKQPPATPWVLQLLTHCAMHASGVAVTADRSNSG